MMCDRCRSEITPAVGWVRHERQGTVECGKCLADAPRPEFGRGYRTKAAESRHRGAEATKRTKAEKRATKWKYSPV